MGRSGGVVPMVVIMMVMMVMVREIGAARILFLAPVSFYSHKNFYMGIAEGLAERGHMVTMVSPFPPTRPQPGIREVMIPEGDLSDAVPNLFVEGQMKFVLNIVDIMKVRCFKSFETTGMKQIQEEEFDVVLYSVANSECLLPVAHTFQVPIIYVFPNVYNSYVSDMGHSPHFSSLTAYYFLGLSHPLSFFGRILSALFDTLQVVSIETMIPMLESECRALQLCPPDIPPLLDLRRNGSLFIVNSVRTLESPTMPYTPTVIHAGGITCRPPKPLPQNLQEWAAGSGEAGFIYFSLGSVVKPSDMPEKYLWVLLKVFGSLDQRVLWTWNEDTIEGLPPNVRISKWLPQQDVLGDPRVRLFITHGGLLSLQEATYHGVPILGLPVFVDQNHNLKNVVREGWGRMLYWEDLTYDNLRNNILQIINDKRLSEKVSDRSRVMQDQPMTPKAWTSYWVEYVMRHQGATHLRCPVNDMPWYELYNVDVWVTLVVVVVLVMALWIYLSVKILKCIISFFGRKHKQE